MSATKEYQNREFMKSLQQARYIWDNAAIKASQQIATMPRGAKRAVLEAYRQQCWDAADRAQDMVIRIYDEIYGETTTNDVTTMTHWDLIRRDIELRAILGRSVSLEDEDIEDMMKEHAEVIAEIERRGITIELKSKA